MKRRSAIKDDLFAAEHRREKIDRLGDPLVEIEAHIDFGSLAAKVGRNMRALVDASPWAQAFDRSRAAPAADRSVYQGARRVS